MTKHGSTFTFCWERDFACRLTPALYHGHIAKSDAARIVVRHPVPAGERPTLTDCVRRWPAPVLTEQR